MTIHLRMHTKNSGLIPGLYPEPFQFPGGEWDLRHVPEVSPNEGIVTLIADMRGPDANDLVKAALWADVAHRGNFGPNRLDSKFVLMLPYLPAARADRGNPIGATVYTRLIRALQPDRVVGLDPHSPFIVQNLGMTLRLASHNDLLKEALSVNQKTYDGIICPDKGAVERTRITAEVLGLPVYHAEKVRDFETGRLSGFKMIDDPPKTGKLLVVDDICDGGGTFKGLAQHLSDRYDIELDRLGLWVTHGIFSGNAYELRSYYSDIMTTDSHPGCFTVGVATTIVPCFQAMYDVAFLNRRP